MWDPEAGGRGLWGVQVEGLSQHHLGRLLTNAFAGCDGREEHVFCQSAELRGSVTAPRRLGFLDADTQQQARDADTTETYIARPQPPRVVSSSRDLGPAGTDQLGKTLEHKRQTSC